MKYDFNNYSPNLLTRLGYYIAGIGVAYNFKGFKGALNYMLIEPTMLIIKLIYNHTKLGNKFIKKIVNKNIPENKILLSDIMFSNKPIDYKGFYESLSNDEKEQYHKKGEEILRKTIEEYNIKDKEQINKLRNIINFKDEK